VNTKKEEPLFHFSINSEFPPIIELVFFTKRAFCKSEEFGRSIVDFSMIPIGCCISDWILVRKNDSIIEPLLVFLKIHIKQPSQEPFKTENLTFSDVLNVGYTD
jgi:hypothetical protein